jgi:acyl carrier protein
VDQFYGQLAEILDVDVVSADDKLREFENWDSLTILSICAMADSSYRVSVSAGDMQQCVSAGDLARLIAGRMRD